MNAEWKRQPIPNVMHLDKSTHEIVHELLQLLHVIINTYSMSGGGYDMVKGQRGP